MILSGWQQLMSRPERRSRPWFSDLRGFTQIAETAGPDQILPFLNDYAEAVISSVHEVGGDVLKLIGDGTLAIFKAGDPGEACRCALAAEALMRERVATLNASRAARGHPTTQPYLGLHIGEVFYGNIGSDDRLDFTVVGPAVNEASRIAALCRSVDKEVLFSSAFKSAALANDRVRLVSWAATHSKESNELRSYSRSVATEPVQEPASQRCQELRDYG